MMQPLSEGGKGGIIREAGEDGNDGYSFACLPLVTEGAATGEDGVIEVR